MLDGRKEIKVLCVIESLGVGGAERLLVSLLPHIAKKNVHIDVVSLFNDTSLSQELEERNIKVLPFNIALIKFHTQLWLGVCFLICR